MFIYILMGGIFILSMIVQSSLKSKFAKYSKIPLAVPMAGRDIANAMLQQNGCGDVQVTSVSGQLTDHFNPANRTVNLSEPVYGTNSGSGCPRVWPCHPAQGGLQHVATAHQDGALGIFCFQHYPVALACRYCSGSSDADSLVYRHRPVCCNGPV